MRVIEVPAEENLAPFSQFLWQHGLAHRIFEESGRQVVEIADERVAEEVRRAYDAWRSGRLQITPLRSHGAATLPVFERLGNLLTLYPGLFAVLLLTLLIAPFSMALVDGRVNEVALALTVVDLRTTDTVSLAQLASAGQIWRWLTPIFLHFSIVHLVFNCVVTFDLGRRVEAQQGSLHLLLLIAGLGLASNAGQVLMNTNPLFGGLSGVAYGLLGYLLVMQRRFPHNPHWRLPPGFAIGLLIFLVIFSTGITEPFGLHVANAAHWSGLIAGAGVALVAGEGVKTDVEG